MSAPYLGYTDTEANADLNEHVTRLTWLDLGDVRRYDAHLNGVDDDRDAIADADAAISAPGGEIKIAKGTARISSDLGIAGDLAFARGAMVSVDAGVTLTIDGAILGDPTWQIFTGDGNVRFGVGQTTFRPEWFGVQLDDGTAGYGNGATIGTAPWLATVAAWKLRCIANSVAMQKLIDSIPGAGSSDRYQMNRQKVIVWRAGYYGFYPGPDGEYTINIKNRRITFASDGLGGSEFTTVIRTYSLSTDPDDGVTQYATFHILGNPGTAPLFLDVSGEITFTGLRFDAAPEFTLVQPIVQVGGVRSGSNYVADGANPVTGIVFDRVGFAQVFAAVRFTYAGACQFKNFLTDGTYYGVLLTHATQEINISHGRFNASAFYPIQLKAYGIPLNSQGSPVPDPAWLRTSDIEFSGGGDYAGTTGGFTGLIEVDNDPDNFLDGLEIFDWRALAVGNKQDAVFHVDPNSAAFNLGYVKHVHLGGRTRILEWPANTTHWRQFLKIWGAGSDYIYVDPTIDWGLTQDAAAQAAGEPWYEIPDSVLHGNVPNIVTVTIAAGAHFDLPLTFQFGKAILLDTGDGEIAEFLCSKGVTGVAQQELVKQTANNVFAAGLITASKLNFGWYAADFVFRLLNNRASDRTIRVCLQYADPYGYQ